MSSCGRSSPGGRRWCGREGAEDRGPQAAAQGRPEVTGSPSEVRVTTPVFEGPIDLLLTLANRRQVDLNQIRLADLTSDYLAAIQTAASEHTPEQMASFLVV